MSRITQSTAPKTKTRPLLSQFKGQQRFVAIAVRGLALVFGLVAWSPIHGQNFDNEETGEPAAAKGVGFGEAKTTHWRVGAIVAAKRGPVAGIICTIPEPTDWPEQTVKLIKEDVSPGVRFKHRDLGGVKQLVVKIPKLANGKKAKALFTYEITRRTITSPPDPTAFKFPKKVSRADKRWLGNSPYISTRDRSIKSLAKETYRSLDGEGVWKQVEGLYDVVREKVEYKEGPIKTASRALRDGSGDCEELTSLFIAMCRVNGIPARMVWVPDHCYPEFYLQDDEGNGHWFPCQAAGTRAFGEMPERRPILQKGDNFKVPEKTKPQRYVSEFMTGKPVRGSGPPEHKFVRELVQPELEAAVR